MSVTHILSGVIALQLALTGIAPVASASTAGSHLGLEPHCIEEQRQRCAQFAAADGTRLQTAPLHVGDILDLDIVVTPNGTSDIQMIRSWLRYNPTLLEARSIDLTRVVTQPIPGENTIDRGAGLVKIGGNVDTAALAESTHGIAIARVTFRVLATTQNTTISFENASEEAPSNLEVIFARAEPVSVSTTVSDTPSSFSLLHIQNVRVTSQDTSIFLDWQPLKSSELAGYNVYYGTVTGQYIQRRSIAPNAHNLVIRDLPSGTTYYFSVRGFNARQDESVFSQEVSVTIGNPESSTAPLSATQSEIPRRNPVPLHDGNDISGATGTSDTVLWIALLAGLIGTGFAARRQYDLLSAPHGI